MFVAAIRRISTPKEVRDHLAVLEPRVEDAAGADAETGEDDVETTSPEEFEARIGRLSLMRHLLELDHLGIS